MEEGRSESPKEHHQPLYSLSITNRDFTSWETPVQTPSGHRQVLYMNETEWEWGTRKWWSHLQGTSPLNPRWCYCEKMQLQCCQIFLFSRKARNLNHVNLSSFTLGQPIQLKKKNTVGPKRTHLQHVHGLQTASLQPWPIDLKWICVKVETSTLCCQAGQTYSSHRSFLDI